MFKIIFIFAVISVLTFVAYGLPASPVNEPVVFLDATSLGEVEVVTDASHFFLRNFTNVDGALFINKHVNPILKKYDPSMFQNLPHFMVAFETTIERKKEIEKVLKVIRKFGLEKIINVAFIHRHFQISDSEMLVEFMSDDFSEISVVDINSHVGASAVQFPYMFAVTKDSDGASLVPLEFLYFNEYQQDQRLQLEKSLRKITGIPSFVEELEKTLVSINSTEWLGLTIKHRMHLGSSTVESSDEIERILTIRKKKAVENQNSENYVSAVVAWGAEIDPIEVPICTHCKHCVHQCNHACGHKKK